MAGYIGNIPTPETTQEREIFSATASQTVFTLTSSEYEVGFVDVFLNGVKLVNGTDFTALDGTTITLTVGAELNDTLEVVSYSASIMVGNMVISTTLPSNASDGDFWWNSETGTVYIYYQDTDSAQWVELFSDSSAGWSNDGTALTYTGALNVGIGVNAPANELEVDGNVVVSGDITAFGTVSDINTKQNIEPIKNAIEKINALNGITFEYKDNPDERMTGLIAQDVEKVLPEAVYNVNEETIAVRYHNMIGLLVEAIKEQQQEINELKRRLDGGI